MRLWRFTGMVVLLLATTGCAAVRAMPARTQEAFSDPVRTRNLATRVLEGAIGAGAAIGCAVALGPVGFLCGPVAEFLAYEFVLEPLGVTGPYFERGPRLPVIASDGSVAESGEIYREATEAECIFYRKTWQPDPARPSGGWCE